MPRALLVVESGHAPSVMLATASIRPPQRNIVRHITLPRGVVAYPQHGASSVASSRQGYRIPSVILVRYTNRSGVQLLCKGSGVMLAGLHAYDGRCRAEEQRRRLLCHQIFLIPMGLPFSHFACGGEAYPFLAANSLQGPLPAISISMLSSTFLSHKQASSGSCLQIFA